MTRNTDPFLRAVQPSENDVRLARGSAAGLARVEPEGGALTLTVGVGGVEEEVTIPASAFEMLEAILAEMAEGHAVGLAPVDREVSTQVAADVLNVSRPFLVGLLESGKIPFRRVGTHRRIRLADVLAYRARMDAEADRAFSDLVAQGQELRMGYE